MDETTADPSENYFAPLIADLQHEAVPRVSHDLLRAIGPVVYAIQTKDGLIKIGWTSDLARRSGQVGYGQRAIIGFMRGDLADELAIHARLKGLAVRGREWYPWHSQVLAVVNEMRAGWGIDPIIEPRSATRPRTPNYRGTKKTAA